MHNPMLDPNYIHVALKAKAEQIVEEEAIAAGERARKRVMEMSNQFCVSILQDVRISMDGPDRLIVQIVHKEGKHE